MTILCDQEENLNKENIYLTWPTSLTYSFTAALSLPFAGAVLNADLTTWCDQEGNLNKKNPKISIWPDPTSLNLIDVHIKKKDYVRYK